jgi:hypothetical protein
LNLPASGDPFCIKGWDANIEKMMRYNKWDTRIPTILDSLDGLETTHPSRKPLKSIYVKASLQLVC